MRSGPTWSPSRLQALVKVGIETDRGPWVAALVAAGYEVFAINPLSVARYRERHSTSGAKSDAGDAHLLAEIVRLDRAHHRPLAGDSEQAEAIKLVARTHQSLIWDRTRHVLRLRAALREFFPAALDAFDDLDAPDALELLAAAPDPDRAARLTRRRSPRRCGGRTGATSRPRPRRSSRSAARRGAAPARPRSRPPTPRSWPARPPHAGAQRRDRGAGRGGGRPFWPAPGR